MAVRSRGTGSDFGEKPVKSVKLVRKMVKLVIQNSENRDVSHLYTHVPDTADFRCWIDRRSVELYETGRHIHVGSDVDRWPLAFATLT